MAVDGNISALAKAYDGSQAACNLALIPCTSLGIKWGEEGGKAQSGATDCERKGNSNGDI